MLSYNRITYPRKLQPSNTSPLLFLKSLGLVSDGETTDDTRGLSAAEVLSALHEEGHSALLAMLWEKTGGIDVTSLKVPIEVELETVSEREESPTPTATASVIAGPDKMMDFEHSPVTFVQIAVRGVARASAAISVNRVHRIIDVCVFDPACTLTPEQLRETSVGMVDWLRRNVGDGWAIRAEEYSDCMCPQELAGLGKSSEFWYLLMVLMKSYLPHVRTSDHQAALRAEAFSAGLTLQQVITLVARKVYSMILAEQRQPSC